MENMQYGQETQVQENQEQNAPAVQNTQAQEITQAQAAGVVDFTQAKKPEDKSLNYTHKFAKPVEIMGQKYSSLTFYFEKLTGDDVEAVELELQQRNIVVLSAEVSSAFQSSIANFLRKQSYRLARLSHTPVNYWMGLPLNRLFNWIRSVNEVEKEDEAARNNQK